MIFYLFVLLILINTFFGGAPQIPWLSRKLLRGPKDSEEEAWRTWIHENLNEGNYDPAEGQYSLLCVVGWSRFNIIVFVVIPFFLVSVMSVAFGIAWSQDIGAHKSDVTGAWAISTFVVTLAAGEFLCGESVEKDADDLSSYVGAGGDYWRCCLSISIGSVGYYSGISFQITYATSQFLPFELFKMMSRPFHLSISVFSTMFNIEG